MIEIILDAAIIVVSLFVVLNLVLVGYVISNMVKHKSTVESN